MRRLSAYFATNAVAPSHARLKMDFMDFAKVGDSMMRPMSSFGFRERMATLFS